MKKYHAEAKYKKNIMFADTTEREEIEDEVMWLNTVK